MHEFYFKEWSIEFVPAKVPGWINIVANRVIDTGTRKIKKRNGAWATAPAERTKYVLGWNGERIAVGSEYKAIRKQHKALFLAICEKVGVAP
jgi:hypothetical protein